jgi:glycine cleavage system H protein
MSTTYFTEEHEWLTVDGSEATVGITNHAQDQLGDIVFVELPAVDDEVEQGGDSVVIESVKAASDVYAPVSGTVTEVKSALDDEPTMVNAGAESTGWLYKMKLSNADELNELMDLDAYKELIG